MLACALGPCDEGFACPGGPTCTFNNFDASLPYITKCFLSNVPV